MAFEEKYLSRKKVAEKLGISVWSWDKIVKSGKAPASVMISRDPRMRRWKASEIEAWIEAHKGETADMAEEEEIIHDDDHPVVGD